MKRIVLYKSVTMEKGQTELKMVDFGVESKRSLYEKLGYIVIEWIAEKVKKVVETADEKWSRFRRVVEAATTMILGKTSIAFA